MDLIMDPEKTPEETLLESFYVLKELHRNTPLTTELVEDYFQRRQFTSWKELSAR